jgi:Holliday junction resolvase RusA-like endonuclease
MRKIELDIFGLPTPQGSKKLMRGRMIEASGDKLKRWRKAIADSCTAYQSQNIVLGAVAVEVSFYLPRPPSVKQTKRPFPIVPPDLDKLCRGLLDGIGQSGAIWGDDSQVVGIKAFKYYADNREPGAEVRITVL